MCLFAGSLYAEINFTSADGHKSTGSFAGPDYLSRTTPDTFSAVDTFIIIDGSNEMVYGNRSDVTVLCTKLT